MKLFKSWITGLAVVMFVVSFACMARADWGHDKMQHESDIKALKDSAVVLQATHPDLENSLTEIAVRKETMMKRAQASHESVMNTVTEAAEALQKVNPDLSTRLTAYLDMEMKETEETEMAEGEEHTVTLFREAAIALRGPNPVLSEKLTVAANKKEMKLQCMKDKKEVAEEKEVSM